MDIKMTETQTAQSVADFPLSLSPLDVNVNFDTPDILNQEVVDMFKQQQQQQQNRPVNNKICRVCLSLVEDSVEINTVEQSTGFMPFRDKLALVVPEMMLDMIQDPVICIPCSEELKQAYEFKNKCMQTEEKIRRLVQNCGGVIYSLDLSNIANRSKVKIKQLPPLTPLADKPVTSSFPPAVILKVEKQTAKKTMASDGQSNEVIVVADETSENEAEIEFHAVNECAERNASEVEEQPLLVPKSEELIDINDDPLFFCEEKKGKINRVTCNFCGKCFLGMFCLRNHQRMCAGAIAHIKEIQGEIEKKVPITIPETFMRRKRRCTTEKFEIKKETKRPGTRITLPEKAKNVLQMWLFKHRDNPYPSDVDKLELVKETNLTLVQVENWFINARRRILQKMLSTGNKYEARLLKGICSDDDFV